MNPPSFPKNFLWGAGTAAHQVEGGMVNTWSEWESAHAEKLAQDAARRFGSLPSWEAVRAEAQDPRNYISGAAVDHYNRYIEDFDLIKKLHMNSFRFSIEWSRIEPEEGKWDSKEIEHYRRYIKSLKARGIEPVLTLWHWTLPIWFAEKSGFKSRANLQYFDRFVQKIVTEYGDALHYVITLNEPSSYAATGYLTGALPPQQKGVISFLTVYRNLVLAHRRAYTILKRTKPTLQVGVAMAMRDHKPKRAHNPLDQAAAYVAGYAWNRWFINRIKRHQDFIGINYYQTSHCQGFVWRDPPAPVNDMGWYMNPEGLLPLLTQTYTRYKKPIIITENGVADASDKHRRWWIEQTLAVMQQALSRGVDLRGYLHWTLLDNFEWSYGWWPKFGLIAVDRQNNMKRTIRPSARWFGEYLARAKRRETSLEKKRKQIS